VSTIALFLVMTGGAAVAASQIGTRSIEKNAVTTGKIAPGAVTTKRIAGSAVRSRQIARRAVQTPAIAKQAVSPGKLQFPVGYIASPTGGAAAVTNSLEPYPVEGATWTQQPGQINVVFGEGIGTLAYDGDGSGACQVYFEISINGQQVGGGELRTDSTSLTEVTRSLGAEPAIDPLSARDVEMTIRTASNGDCTPDSTIDSTRFRVLAFG